MLVNAQQFEHVFYTELKYRAAGFHVEYLCNISIDTVHGTLPSYHCLVVGAWVPPRCFQRMHEKRWRSPETRLLKDLKKVPLG